MRSFVSWVDAAAAAGVDRTTVHKWRKDHSGFRAMLNRRRREFLDAIQLRRETLAEQALANVAKAIAAGDLNASKYVLDRLALLPTAPPTSALEEDPLYLRLQTTLRELEDFKTLEDAAKKLSRADVEERLAMLEDAHPGARRWLEAMSARWGFDGTLAKLHKIVQEQSARAEPGSATPEGGKRLRDGSGRADRGCARRRGPSRQRRQ